MYRRCLALADALAALGAIALAVSLSRPPQSFGLLALAPLVVVLGKLFGIYDREDVLIRKATLDEAPALFQLATSFALLLWLADGVLITGAHGRRSLLLLWVGLFVLLLGLRTLARAVASRLTPAERCLVIADDLTCKWLEEVFRRRRVLHATVVGRINPRDAGNDPGGATLPLETGDLRDLTALRRIDRIVVGSQIGTGEEVVNLIRTATSLGLRVSMMPRALEVVGSAAEFDEIDGLPLLSMHRPRVSRSSWILKRALDLFASAVVLLLLGPFLLLIAAAIKLTSPGPVLFSQFRVGRNGQTFRMFKFRTMVVDAEQQKKGLAQLNEACGLFKITNDPRCTSIGRFLRRGSLDELPQLINVLRGEMSLVGPRPLIVEEDQRIQGWHRRRLQLTPGMTGHWQVLGSARIPLEEMVRIDYLYVTNWSLWLDLKILLRTIPFMLTRQGM